LTIRKIALGVCLLFTGTALAQEKTYTVKEGDTLSDIASKFGVPSKAILQANRLPSANKLKLGQRLNIPAASPKPKTISALHGYSVQPGDNDESIAKKLGVTAKALRLANLGVKWTKLQIGQAIAIPNAKGWFETLASKASKATTPPVLASKSPVAPILASAKTKVVPKTYQVHDGDNDWIIAKRLGIKPSELRTLNPTVKWTNLKIGTLLRVPGTVEKTIGGTTPILANHDPKDPNLPKLRSRYAVVTGDGVTVRRGPSMRFDSITKVDHGTRVLVLDREGSWYKLRFPKGTEAWVRGDFLAPTKAPQILASNTNKSHKSNSKATVVASNSGRRSSSRDSRFARSGNARRPQYSGSTVVASGNGDTIMEKADSFLGVRYRYGAMSRSATDCSGFVGQVYRGVGVKLPRTAREMSTRGQKIDRSNLKPGDLLFFNTRGSRISHVAIYKGDGKFIHASSGGGKVMVSSMSDGYYNRRFAGARRVVSTKATSKKGPAKVAKAEEPKSIAAEPVSVPVEPKVSTPPDGGK